LLDQLLNPPFARNPAFQADAKIVGIVLAILSGIALLFGLLALPLALGLLGLVPFLALSLIGSLIGAALTLYGGYQMYRLKPDGKRWVVYGLGVYLIGIVLGILAGGFFDQIIPLVVLAAVYYVVVTSKFAGEGEARIP
jgi:uncharacterized membrane protein YfcA